MQTTVRKAFSLDSSLGGWIRALWEPASVRNWSSQADGPRHFFLDRAFDARGFLGAWDAARVTGCGAEGEGPRTAWATPFNPDYTHRDVPRHDTWELLTCDGETRVARLILFFKYRNVSLPSGARALPDALPQDLAVVQWLELDAGDTAYAAFHNGSSTFEVRRPAAREVVQVRWLVRSRLVVPCGMMSRLAGAFWVWDE